MVGWSVVWLGGVWCTSVHGVRCGWVECVSVHECGFVMECRTANPSPSVAVSLVHLATQPFTELAILC